MLLVLVQKKKEEVGTDMYLQAVRQLGHRLLQEQRHEQEVELGHVGVFGQQRLQHREPREVARVPVDLPQRGAAAGAAAHVETWRTPHHTAKQRRRKKKMSESVKKKKKSEKLE